MEFLVGLARDVVAAARVQPSAANTTGGPLLQPSGRCAYPAFWLRDHALSVASGLITLEEQRHAILLAARTQQAEDWLTPSGSTVLRGSIADHINFDGSAVFFPGTLDATVQSSAWGNRPAIDDHFLLVEMVWEYCRQSGSRSILTEPVAGLTLVERITWAFTVPPVRPDSQLVWCDESARGANFGFLDAVIQTGDLLFASVLRHRAALQLVELTGSVVYAAIAQAIASAIPTVFVHPGGLLRASTGLSSQPDVFGSAYAVYVDVVAGTTRQRICRALADAYRAGTLARRGGVRNVLTTDDHRADSAWERTVGPMPFNQYQNGAYWLPPVGWVCAAIAEVDAPLARHLADDYLAELRATDFRRGPGCDGPYECIHPDGDHRHTPVCMPSVTLPLAAFRRLGWLAA